MRKIGAKNIFMIRHGERLDKVNLNWSPNALRPQDTPLSAMGHKQASHLGKWLYSKIPIRKPAKIFCSPFIRCVQTANEIAKQLESLQNSGTFSTNISEICIEPGICEDPYYMKNMVCNQPWFLNAADLIAISHRIKLNYIPIRQVSYKETNGKRYIENTPTSTEERLHNIVHEIIHHPYVHEEGTAIIVTHAKPCVDMLRSLNPIIENIHIPHYEQIKYETYDGPPIQYTACTHMTFEDNQWGLHKESKLFSNEHDPNLKNLRRYKRKKIIRYAFDEQILNESTPFIHSENKPLTNVEISSDEIFNKQPNEIIEISRFNSIIRFTVPPDYKNGDKIIVKTIIKK